MSVTDKNTLELILLKVSAESATKFYNFSKK